MITCGDDDMVVLITFGDFNRATVMWRSQEVMLMEEFDRKVFSVCLKVLPNSFPGVDWQFIVNDE